MAHHVIPYISMAAGEYYLVLMRDNILHISLHNVTAWGDYSVISRDDVPHGTAAGGVLKKREGS